MTDLPNTLTKNQALVIGVLSQSQLPLSAYAILDELRDEGVKAPLQVYRALDKLIEMGLAHRLESLNAFVACNSLVKHQASQPSKHQTNYQKYEAHETAAFMICETCGCADEISDNALEAHLKHLAAEFGFTPRHSTIELRGLCGKCEASPD